MQGPLDLGPYSEPEPDVAVVPGPRARYATQHPRTAVLVVEVSDTTLAYDRTHKASLYAAAGIEDYWIINLVDGQVEVRRDPVPDPIQPHGHTYATLTVLRPPASVAPLAAPGAGLAIADLLP
jgi:Uma2 family endonuclease